MRTGAIALAALAAAGAAMPSAAQTQRELAPISAPRVSVLSADLGPMARIELTWPVHFDVQSTDDRRLLVLTFDQPFNAPDLGALRQRLGNWIAGISKSADRIEIRAAQDVFFDVYKDRRQLTIEMTYASNFLPGIAGRRNPGVDRIELTPPGAAAPQTPGPTARQQAVAAPPPPPERPDDPPAGAIDDRAREAADRLRISGERRSGSLSRSQASQSVTVTDSFVSHMEAVSRVSVEIGADNARIDIDWLRPVGVTASEEGRELLLRLDRPLEEGLTDGLAEKLPDWLQGVSTGYDTVLLIGEADVRFETEHAGANTSILLRRASAEEGAGRDASDVRLDILRARLAARQGETGEARQKLESLQTENPDNADVLIEMASIEASVGSWRRASNLYDRAIGVDPQRRDAAAASRALDREFGSQLRLDIDYQQVKDGDLQIIGVLSGQFLPTDMIDAGFRFENRYLDDDQVLRANGVTEAVTIHRQRGEAWIGGSPSSGHRVEGALLGSAAGPGAALRYNYRTPDTLTGISATWNRAYWDLVEGIADDAAQDRLVLSHERQLNPRWSANGEVAVNRYSIDDIDTAATSLDLSAAVNYLVPWEAADLSVGYSFDGQYVGSIETRIDANGNAFNPLPLTDTEFHAINVSLGDVIGEDWRYLVFASFSLDRVGDGIGPSVGGELIWEPDEDFQFGLRAGHSRVSGRGDDAVFTRVGGHLLVRF
ncbi:MAG: tetratricopeptide repeat protein [Minwuia sp.]|uniref:tetratricopeptide repeat protein n=1 Tax=Minwuia sp. TaxID=2493630 RepID=UPI003A88E0C7